MSAAARTYAQDLLSEMRACAAEHDDSRRLACYDRSLHRWADRPADRPSPQAQPIASASAAAERQFGTNEELARKLEGVQAPPRLDKVQARVSAVWRKLRGEPVVKLENGQVWEAAEGEKPIELKAGDLVTIWPGLFGSYRLSAGNAIVRVSRVQ